MSPPAPVPRLQTGAGRLWPHTTKTWHCQRVTGVAGDRNGKAAAPILLADVGVCVHTKTSINRRVFRGTSFWVHHRTKALGVRCEFHQTLVAPPLGGPEAKAPSSITRSAASGPTGLVGYTPRGLQNSQGKRAEEPASKTRFHSVPPKPSELQSTCSVTAGWQNYTFTPKVTA